MQTLPPPPADSDNDALAQLIASTPAILGFNPDESMIVYIVTEDPRHLAVMRVDLPTHHDSPARRQEHHEQARQMAAAAITNDAKFAHIWVISSRPDAANEAFIDAVQDAFQYDGVPIAHACLLRTVEAGATWRCCRHADCGGTLPDPRSVPAAAAAVAAGLPTYADRDELKRHLAPESDDRIAEVAARLAHAGAAPVDRLHGWKVIIDSLLAADKSPNLPVLSPDTVATLSSALEDPVLRDTYQHLATESTAAVRLMTALVRSTPCPERATPAALLATHQYTAGDGARAQVALDVALEADPNHSLATVLRAVFNIGVPPTELRAIIRDAIRD